MTHVTFAAFLGSWEIVVIVVTLLVLLAAIGTVVSLIVHFSRGKKNPVPPLSPISPIHPAAGHHRFKAGLLLSLLAGMVAVICFVFVPRSQDSVEVLSEPEFLRAFDSNRVVSATIVFDPRTSPLARITGTYKKRDQFNNETVARFVVEYAFLPDDVEGRLLRTRLLNGMPVTIQQPNALLISALWTIVPFILIGPMGLALVAIILYLIHRTFKNRKAASIPPIVPKTQVLSRQCPQCGTELKPDVSEGLCPACLLQRGIATEGGVPPGTPPFVPPTIPDLARLFPQLEILELIGKGGMGAVYQARQPALDRFVALKILAPRSGDDHDFAGRFTREARALAKLSHPNIVAVYDFGQAGHLSYFIMEFVDGPNLRQVEQAGKLSPREALEIIPQICAALQFAHDEGIVHRDIKPENVLLDKKGRVKIADFGLAKILGTDPGDFRLTGARDVVGTPHYMAPEQVEKPQAVDHRADIYSLGVVFYEMLTGELPLGKFQPPSSCARGMQIDVRLDEVVLHALEKAPERRYQQASQVKTAVETIAAGAAQLEVGNQKPRIAPRFSRTAIAGACWLALFFFVALRWTRVLIFHSFPAMPQPSSLSLLLLGLFGAMILGWIAVSQIRRSAGKLYGMGLAVFDGLFFPLLALDGLIAGMAYFLMKCLAAKQAYYAIPGQPFVLPWTAFWWIPLLALLVVIVTNFLIIWLVWRTVNKSVGAPAPPIQKPDRFWRRFAVVMACVVLIPIAIAILGLLAAIAVPNFVRARHQAQHNAAQQWTQEGWQLWQARKLDQAAAKFQQAVQLAPDDADAWNGLGWATFNSGKSPEAEQAFLKAISLDTNQPGALNGLGQIYLSQRKYDLSEAYLLRAAPQAPAAGYGLTRLYLLEGKFDQAESWAQKLVDSGQADDLARQMLAAAQEKHLGEDLRLKIEPPPPAASGSTPAGSTTANFVPAAGVESAADTGQTLAEQPPVVVETWPVSGTRDAEPGVVEVRVRFSKPMADGSWSWSTAWENSTPETVGQIHYEPDQRTCVLKAKLEPGRTYAWWLNSGKFKNFTDLAGRPAVPYLLIFQTKGSAAPPTREGRWQKDLEYFEAELPGRHMDFSQLVLPTDFHRAVTELKQNVANLSDPEIIIGLMRLVAGIGVAHTQLDWQAKASAFHKYPVQMRWYSDGLAVLATSPEYREALGARVLRIGSLTPEQLEQALGAYVSHENEPWLQQESPAYMIIVELLQHLKVTAPDGSVELSVVKAGGKPFTLRISPVEWNADAKDWVTAADVLNLPTPLYRRHPEAFYWRDFLPESRTLYVQYNQCANVPDGSFSDFAAATLAFAGSNSVSRVVVDLRSNAGGNSEVILPLLDGLRNHPALSGKGHLYVLIGKRTFSSGLLDAMYFRDRLHAILVGGPTGGKPNSYGEVKALTLPNSRLAVYYPVKYFRPIPDSDPPSLEPDVTVPFALKDFLAGRDPVLEAALNHSVR